MSSKSIGMLLRRASSMNSARVDKQIDMKLNDQFRYFRREFMEAASVQGVTMPLELVEDKSGRFFTFVNANGPRYLLHIIHSQPEASAIMRCAISLLIVSMAILRRKLPENRAKAAATNWMSLLSGNINNWAFKILVTVSDGASVSICINLLAKSKILVIRELVLSLLALLVNTSEESVIQMLTSPTHQQITAKEMEERYRKENPSAPANYKLSIDDKVKFNPTNTFGNCLSVMFAVVADNRNHYSIVSACAEVVIAMTSGSHGSAKVALAIAQTSIQGPPPKERKESEQSTLLKTVFKPRSNASSTPNRPSTAASPLTPSPKRLPSRGGDGASIGTGASFGELAPAVAHPQLATWDAVHILVQFLQRFFRYTDILTPDQSWNSMSALDRQRLIQAHNRIVYAVSVLITLAPEVGYYIYQMPKARNIVVTSAKFFLAAHLPVGSSKSTSVGVVGTAMEMLSPEYQASGLLLGAGAGAGAGALPRQNSGGQGFLPAPLSRNNSSALCSFCEDGPGPQAGGRREGFPAVVSPGFASPGQRQKTVKKGRSQANIIHYIRHIH
jgi:hypothetical protein